MSSFQEVGRIAGAEAVDYRVGLKELPPTSRPRERLLQQGAGALSNDELVAIILRTGSSAGNVLELAHKLLASYGGLVGLVKASVEELCSTKGLGGAKAAQLKAAFELGRRAVSVSPDHRHQVRSPSDVADLLMPEMAGLEQEHLRVVLLNTRNQVTSVPEVYKGSLNTSVIRVGELFREAIRQNSAAVVVVHNHPSGDPTPSSEDVAVTRRVVEAGKLLDIEVLDHLIIGQQQFVSLRERGVAFDR